MVWRMNASRRCSYALGRRATRRSSAIASVSIGNGDEPSSRDSTRSSHHRSGSSYPAAAANAPSGSPLGSSATGGSWSSKRVRVRGASVTAAGRSQSPTSIPRRAAQSIACHSGENSAYGQNAEIFGSSAAYASRASGGSMPSAVTQPSSGSASAGPSTSTTSGE